MNMQGQSFRFIRLDETIEPGDFVRSICQDNPDGPGWDTTHAEYDHAKWQPVEKYMPYWIGHIFNEYVIGTKIGHACEEIIRSTAPVYSPKEIA